MKPIPIPRLLTATLLLGAALLLRHDVRAAAPSAPPAGVRPDDQVLAVVDGIPLTKLQWDKLAGPYFQEVQARAGRALTPDEEVLLRKNVLQELIRERLWVADAKRRGFTVTDAELDARLQRNDYFKTNGKFDPEKFRRFKFSPESNYREIQDQVRNAVLLDKYAAWMRTRYGVAEADLRKEFQSRTAQASLRYLWLTPDVVTLEPHADAAQIRSYYERHADEFQTPERNRITYIHVPVASGPGASDSLHAAAERKALAAARALIVSLRAGHAPDKLAREFGGLKDSGFFGAGDPIPGLGRSDAVASALQGAPLRQWLPEPVRVGPWFVAVRPEEHRPAGLRPLREAAAMAKHRADAEVRDAVIDSLARLDYAAHPERYRVARLTAMVLARATSSFRDPRPVSEKDIARTLERLRKSSGRPASDRAWADSIAKSLPDLVRQERTLDAAFRSLDEAAARLRRGETPEEVARRYETTLEPASIYQGQPPEIPSLLEGALLDSLYKTSPGVVAGPRVLRDSVFVVRVNELDARFQPPYEAVRVTAHAQIEQQRRDETNREAQAWFDAHRDRYRTPQRWMFDYVLFKKMKPDSAPVPEDSIRAYYETHPREFIIPARARAHHILIAFRPGEGAGARTAARTKAQGVLKRLKAGADFAALAKEISDDRGSGAQGGDLGEITRGQVVKEFGDAVFAMKPGTLSPVVETQFGFHVIRLDSLYPQRLRPLDDCRAEIRGVVGEEMVDSLARVEAVAFAQSASRPGAKFEDLARKHGGAVSSGPVSAREMVPGLGLVPDLETQIGSLPEGGVSRPIPLELGYLVARLTRAMPPRPATFGEVHDQAVQDLSAERRRAAADSMTQVVQRGLRAGQDLESLALPLGGLRLSRNFPRRGPVPDLARDSVLVRDSTLYREVFAARPGHLLTPHRGAVGTLFAVVDSITTLSPTQYAEHKEDLREELFEQRTAAWTDRLRARAKIDILSKDLNL